MEALPPQRPVRSGLAFHTRPGRHPARCRAQPGRHRPPEVADTLRGFPWSPARHKARAPSHLGPRPTRAPAVPGTTRRGRSLRRSLSGLGAPPPCRAQRTEATARPSRGGTPGHRRDPRPGQERRRGAATARDPTPPHPALPSPRAVPPPPAEEVAASAPALQLPARRPPTPRRPSRQLVRPTRPTFSLVAPGRHSAAGSPTPEGTLGTRVPRAGLSPFGWRRRVGR